MAYIVYCDDEPIYDLRTDDLLLIDPVVSLELNSAGEFTFKMPPTHPLYDLPQKMISRILVEQDGDEIFKGRIIKESTDFYKRKEITCEGELAFLNDSIQRPGEYHDITPREYLELLIANHNNQVDEDRQFTVGIVTVEDSNDSLYRYTNMNSTWTEIKEDLVDDLGGYLKVRNENGIRYLDYVNIEDYGNTNSQPIEFGKNLLDFTRTMDMTDVCTAIIPLGATLEESDFTSLEVRLTIEDVNDGVDYIQIDEAVEEYGFICKTVEWDSVTTAAALLTKAQAYLTDYQWDPLVIEANAVDLYLTDTDNMPFRLGDYIEIVSTPHGLDKFFPLSKMEIPLDKPSSSSVTLGEEEDISMSGQSSSLSSDLIKIQSQIPTSFEEFKQSAVDQASALITAATHGYVMLNDVDDDGYPDELVIMDTDDTETATNVWRWNLNGLGYSSTGYNGTYGTAITMDGQIVGSYIVANSITAEKLSVAYTQSVTDEINDTIEYYIRTTDDGLEISKLEDGEYVTSRTLIDNTGMTIVSADGETPYSSFTKNGVTFYASGEELVNIYLTSSGYMRIEGGSDMKQMILQNSSTNDDGNASSSGINLYNDDYVSCDIQATSSSSEFSLVEAVAKDGGGGYIRAYMASENSNFDNDLMVYLINSSGNFIASVNKVYFQTPYLYMYQNGYMRIPCIRFGSVTIEIDEAGNICSEIINFNCSYSSKPAVMACASSSVPGTVEEVTCIVGDADDDGKYTYATVYIRRTTSTDTSVRWVSVGYLAEEA